MGSMQITVGIWFFLVNVKSEVTGSRGGIAINMTHAKASRLCLDGGEGNWRARWGQGVAEGKAVQMRRSMIKVGSGDRGEGAWTQREAPVAPSQLLGFIKRFLSRCCFLIDDKMHWPVYGARPRLLPVPSPSPPFPSLTLRVWLTWAVNYGQRGMTDMAAATASGSLPSQRFPL